MLAKKIKKPKKDRSKPKRPASAYSLFMKAQLANVKVRPRLGLCHLGLTVHVVWNTMSG